MTKHLHTEHATKRRIDGKASCGQIKKQHKIPSPLRAIRLHCIECSGNNAADARNCVIGRCPLFPYRMGRGPREEDLKVAKFNNKGKLDGYEPWEGYTK